MAASTLGHRLVDHLLDRYAGLPEPDRRVRAGRLDPVAVDRVADHVDTRIGEVLTLGDLAAPVRFSPFHFHRCFRATTGLAPHAFVTARRMDRARLLARSNAVARLLRNGSGFCTSCDAPLRRPDNVPRIA